VVERGIIRSRIRARPHLAHDQLLEGRLLGELARQLQRDARHQNIAKLLGKMGFNPLKSVGNASLCACSHITSMVHTRNLQGRTSRVPVDRRTLMPVSSGQGAKHTFCTNLINLGCTGAANMSLTISGLAGSHAPQAMSGASARMPPAQKMASLFAKIDSSGSGSISKSQFMQAFQTMNPTSGFRAMGADAVFNALNPSNSGLVCRQNFVQGMTQMIMQFRSGAPGTT
jgi:hypothetical protein